MKKGIKLCFVLFQFILFSQENNTLKNYHRENFVVRAFGYSKLHYFASLSYNNQTIYTTNLLHPQKTVIIFSSDNNGVKTLDFSKDENFLITGNNSGNLEIWDINKRKLFKTIKLHKEAVNKVRTLPLGKSSFISAGNDGKIFLVNFQDTKESILLGSHAGIVRDFDISINNNFLVSIGSGDKLILWNLKEGKKVISINLPSSPSSVKFVSNSNTILVGNTEGDLFLFDEKLRLNKTLKIHDNLITSICALSDDTFVTGSFDGKIKKINLSNLDINELYSSKSYIINIAIKNNRLTFSKRNGELITIEIDPK